MRCLWTGGLNQSYYAKDLSGRSRALLKSMPNGLPPPYPEIYAQLMAGKVIPFLGAGAPLYDRNPKQKPWFQKKQGQEAIDYLPTAAELADYLAARTQLPAEEKGELTKMAQYFEAAVGSAPLRQRLSDIFGHQQPPTPLHEFLARVPAPLLIVTTNYDDLTERAFKALGNPYHVIVHVTGQPRVLFWPHGSHEPTKVPANDLLIDLDKISVIYKMHGAIDRRANEIGNYVITEDDYIEFLTRMTRRSVIPPIFARPFQTRPFLFLGYGLYDWNLRVILNRIQEFRKNPKFKSWAIETLCKPVEQKLWEARGVDVYDGLTLEQFVTSLKKQGEANAGEGGSANRKGNGK
jgi:SIR2-like protein